HHTPSATQRILFIDATSMQSIRSSYRRIAKILGIGENIPNDDAYMATTSELFDSKERFLIIFDNVQPKYGDVFGNAVIYNRIISIIDKHDILIGSVNSAWPIDYFKNITLAELSEKNIRELLKKIICKPIKEED